MDLSEIIILSYNPLRNHSYLPLVEGEPPTCLVCALWNIPVFFTANEAMSANFLITLSPILKYGKPNVCIELH